MSTITAPRLPSGFNEYLPAEQIEFNRLLAIIRTTYEHYGFTPLDTPDIELSEVLLAKGGGETEKQIYRFERGKNDLSLRFDLTVPLARYVVQHQGELAFPFRRYQIGKVHRAERAQAGRFREFYQCDIDVIGSDSSVVDAEFPAIINEIFEQFNFGEFTIRINNRKVLNGFFEALGLGAVAADVLRIVDKIEKISRDDLIAELHDAGCSDEQVTRLLEFIVIRGENSEILHELETIGIENEQFQAGVSELREVLAALAAMRVPEKRVRLDLTIARGLDYYTGTVYETNLNDYPEVGSVCSGGRYDNLTANYSKRSLPGVGISIGLSRLFYKLREAGIINPSRQTLAKVLVAPFGSAQLPRALEVAHELRSVCPVTTYVDDVVIGKKLKYADKLGVRYAVLIGEDEAAAGDVTLKDMQTGENRRMTVRDVCDLLQA
jgi:histidine--tRNA ligase